MVAVVLVLACSRLIEDPWCIPSISCTKGVPHQQDIILLAVLEIALLALLVPNFSQLELVTYIAIDSLDLGLELVNKLAQGNYIGIDKQTYYRQGSWHKGIVLQQIINL
jgi:hypothetical protein